MNKKVTLKAFEEVASKNGYEVFTPEEIASYYKEGLTKSMSGKMNSQEKESFVSDVMGLQKAVLNDENGKETIRFYRKNQVKWEVAKDGTILKGVEGVYADTPENRRLKRVGEEYIASDDILKSIFEVDEDIVKAMRTGRYADTPENRRLHRVGQPYKAREKKGGEPENEDVKKPEKKESHKNVFPTKEEIEKFDFYEEDIEIIENAISKFKKDRKPRYIFMDFGGDISVRTNRNDKYSGEKLIFTISEDSEKNSVKNKEKR